MPAATKTGKSRLAKDFKFQGAYPATIDAKNRLFISSQHKEKLVAATGESEGFVVKVAANNRIWLYAQSYFPEVVAEYESRATTDEELEWVRYDFLGNSVECPRDAQNRILLPGVMLQETGTGKEVHVVGMKDHLEIWNTSEWLEFSRKIRGGASEKLGLRHRLGPGTPAMPVAGQSHSPLTTAE